MKRWGIFFPLYAFRSHNDWGCGTFNDLARLAEWIAPLGGSIVCTLPLLATFLDDPFDPSPYRPVSRLAWNDLYLDLPHERVASTTLVDYRGIAALKRKLLKKLAQDGGALARQQLIAARDKAGQHGVDLYFDLPLGIHPEGIDAKREKDLFDFGISVGAPPDAIFSGGQNWGFPPMRPERLADNDYRYLRQSLRHQFEIAKILRIDHVMWLHRQYWIRPGETARTGSYVTYPADKLYPVFLDEARRAGAILVGENLGTVPAEVEAALDHYGILKMYVAQYEQDPQRTIPANAIASLNTHDMPPFAAARPGADLATLRRELRRLAESDAQIVLVNLEDLWLETEPQNRPGTINPLNWCRKARYTFEEFSQNKDVLETLKMVNACRT